MKKMNNFLRHTLCLSFVLLLAGLIGSAVLTGCSDGGGSNTEKPVVKPDPDDEGTRLDPSDVDAGKIYVPNEFGNMDLYISTSKWFYGRSKQSEHFIVFWDKLYGKNDPGSPAVPAAYRVDIDDLLAKAESFYDINVNQLKFAEPGAGKSNLDKYKMMIFIYYQTEWLATGSGYDDVIGALWVSPNTCQPVGSTIAHEIGHSFQYQVYCDLKNDTGFRYGFGPNGEGGNGFWEQTAQWQSYQSYPEEAFTSYNFTVYKDNHFRHIGHEWQRYASYFIHYYWADKHGKDMIGRIWREARKPEDPVQAYMRITDIDMEAFNDEVYDAATRFVTWDIGSIRALGAAYIGAHNYKLEPQDDGSYKVAYDYCPGTTGYNVIPLGVPEAGTTVSAQFTGLPDEAGFNRIDTWKAGWRYGYVALLDNGARVYGDMHSDKEGTASFTVPADCGRLWFVVTGAPSQYAPHPWDEEEGNDEQWPYKVKFINTDLRSNLQDVAFTYNVSFQASQSAYDGTSHTLSEADKNALAHAFDMQPQDVVNNLGGSIKFYAVESGGTMNATTTANGYGHWFDANGDVCNWGDSNKVFSEYDHGTFTFKIGQHPGACPPGSQYRISQAMVYTSGSGKTATATFVFNISVL